MTTDGEVRYFFARNRLLKTNLLRSQFPPLRTTETGKYKSTRVVGQNPELISARDQDGSLPLHVACRRGASFAIVQSLVNLYKASVKSVTPEGDLPLLLACELPRPSLDTIFLLVKLYPDLVYR
jgi:ankyrin repeat protein